MSTTHEPLIYWGFRVFPKDTQFEYACDAEDALPKGVGLRSSDDGCKWHIFIEASLIDRTGRFTPKLSTSASWLDLADKAMQALGVQVDRCQITMGWYADVWSY